MNKSQTILHLDLRGHRCPYPLVETKVRLKNMQKHECLHVILDDPSSLRDIPKFFRSIGYTVAENSRASGGVDVYIQAVIQSQSNEVSSNSC